MRILILGAGAVGGYFGGRLAEAGADVTFLVRPRRAKQLADNGLVVKSPAGDIRKSVPAIGPGGITGPFDLVILTCKAYDLADAMEAVAPAVGEETAVLPLLNGLAHMDALDARFGGRRVLGGVCHIGATMSAEGEVLHLNTLHVLTIGDRAGVPGEHGEAIAQLLADSPVTVKLSDNIAQDMWEKFVMLASMAAATCLMRAPVGDIMAADAGESVMTEFLDECSRVAAASGHPPRDAASRQALKLLTERGSVFAASMLRDIEKGGPIEADHVIGDMIARAANLNVETPNLRLAHCHLQAYQNRRAREGA